MDKIPLTGQVKQNIFRPVQIIETLIKGNQQLIRGIQPQIQGKVRSLDYLKKYLEKSI